MRYIITLRHQLLVYTATMTDTHRISTYPATEERINIISHALGLLLCTIGLVFLVIKAVAYGPPVHIISAAVFGVSLVTLYASSTIYHSATDPALRRALRTVDHAAIYVLIAGTYTPYALITLEGTVGWTVLGVTWGMALTGITLKLFFTGRFNALSTAMYVCMGWTIIFAIKPLIANLNPDGLTWLFAGGVAYTAGALFYSITKMPFGHATFHVFVLIGSICHFVSVYFFVLAPSNS